MKLQEGQHDLVVHVTGEGLGELPGLQPRHRHPPHLSLVVHALDGEEDLAEGAAAGAVVLPLPAQALGHGGDVRLDGGLRGEGGKEVEHGQGVIQVTQGVPKARVPLLDEVVQGVHGAGLVHPAGCVHLKAPYGALELAGEGLFGGECVVV